MIEEQKALAIANKWLEHPPDMMGDPDCDECVVARELIRQHDINYRLALRLKEKAT